MQIGIVRLFRIEERFGREVSQGECISAEHGAEACIPTMKRHILLRGYT